MVATGTYNGEHRHPFKTYANDFKERFGERVQKISINAGFTCPNRDGTVSTGGCTYCNNQAFQPRYCDPSRTITEQIDEGIAFHKRRYRKVSKYLAYFQSYSNTYKPLAILKQFYTEALSHPAIVGLVIGTRPDCIDAEKLDYLAWLGQHYHVVLEYGVESVFDETLRRVNRGHDFEQAGNAITESAQRGILTSAHFIVGLPGEGKEQIHDMADVIATLPLHSVKFHQLQIVKGTRMEKEYLENPNQFSLFSPDDYLTIMVEVVEKLPPDMIIERLAGESAPDLQVSEGWGMRSDQVMKLFEEKLKLQNTWQGKYYQSKS